MSLHIYLRSLHPHPDHYPPSTRILPMSPHPSHSYLSYRNERYKLQMLTRLKFVSEQKLGVRVNFRFNQVSS